MLTFKLLAPICAFLIGLIEAGLKDKWADKRTTKYKNAKSLLIILMFLATCLTVAIIVFEDASGSKLQENLAIIQNELKDANQRERELRTDLDDALEALREAILQAPQLEHKLKILEERRQILKKRDQISTKQRKAVSGR